MAEENRETRAICPVCMHHCRLTQEQYGRCRARKNSKGKIISINYGKITGLMLDPIEKKPLRRFCPGSRILSVGSFGCNLACPFCQNYEISMTGEPEAEYREISLKNWTDLPGNTRNMEILAWLLPTMSHWWI